MMNQDSYIKKSAGGTSFVGPDATRLIAATTLKLGIKMMHQHGIMPTRGATMKRMLAMAEAYTGKQYKRGQAPQAIADLDLWILTMKAALPIIIEGKQDR